MTDTFYTKLEARSSFRAVIDAEAYVDAPADWHIAITDVRNSTAAIEAGDYRAVNLVGASSIIALLNLVPETDLPFAFGGDGAAVLIPPELVAPARRALLATQAMADAEFDLDLRLGLVPVRDVQADGHALQIAKIDVSEHYQQALFAGGGLAHAEALVKDDASDRYRIDTASADPEADYTGLECRWQDIPSPYGETVTLLVAATTGDAAQDRAVYRDTLHEIERIFGDSEHYRPLNPATLEPSYNPRRLMGETKIRNPEGWWQRMVYCLEIWVRNIILKYLVVNEKTTGSGVRWDKYVETLVATSDFRKYDDTLRMVIASTPDQRAALEQYLAKQHDAGQLAYGLHVTDRALVTCVVFERMGRQVHFVDGADGGYAEAARGLKRRLRTRQSQQHSSAESA